MTIDTPSQRRIILPIRLGIDPMERLLVADFKGDPEFQGIEQQVFDDPINGKGMRVLRYRKDGKVDVYWQPGVRVDKNTFTVGSGIGDFGEVKIKPARLEITGHYVNLHMAFIAAQDLLSKDESVIANCARHLYRSCWTGNGCCSYATLQSR